MIELTHDDGSIETVRTADSSCNECGHAIGSHSITGGCTRCEPFQCHQHYEQVILVRAVSIAERPR